MQTLGMMETIEIPAEKLNFCPTLLFAVQCAKSKHFGRVFHRLFLIQIIGPFALEKQKSFLRNLYISCSLCKTQYP